MESSAKAMHGVHELETATLLCHHFASTLYNVKVSTYGRYVATCNDSLYGLHSTIII